MTSISATVALIVLASAVIHASWNAIAKAIPGRLTASLLVGSGHFVFGGLWCLVAPIPAAASWPYLLTSAVLQSVYLLLLTAAYSHGEFRQVYPVARGTAPVLVTVLALVLLGERLSAWGFAGVALVVAAIGTLASLRGPGSRSAGSATAGSPGADSPEHGARTGLLLALTTGLVIGTYSLVDGIGVRHADASGATGPGPHDAGGALTGSAAGYAAWLMFLHGPLLIAACFALGRGALARALRHTSTRIVTLGIGGGLMSTAAYATVIWAQDRSSLAMVSALRETSVLFAGVIGALIFAERFTLRQTVAAAAVVAGIVLMQV